MCGPWPLNPCLNRGDCFAFIYCCRYCVHGKRPARRLFRSFHTALSASATKLTTHARNRIPSCKAMASLLPRRAIACRAGFMPPLFKTLMSKV